MSNLVNFQFTMEDGTVVDIPLGMIKEITVWRDRVMAGDQVQITFFISNEIMVSRRVHFEDYDVDATIIENKPELGDGMSASPQDT